MILILQLIFYIINTIQTKKREKQMDSIILRWISSLLIQIIGPNPSFSEDAALRDFLATGR